MRLPPTVRGRRQGNASGHEEDRTMTTFDDREKAFEDKYKYD